MTCVQVNQIVNSLSKKVDLFLFVNLQVPVFTNVFKVGERILLLKNTCWLERRETLLS